MASDKGEFDREFYRKNFIITSRIKLAGRYNVPISHVHVEIEPMDDDQMWDVRSLEVSYEIRKGKKTIRETETYGHIISGEKMGESSLRTLDLMLGCYNTNVPRVLSGIAGMFNDFGEADQLSGKTVLDERDVPVDPRADVKLIDYAPKDASGYENGGHLMVKYSAKVKVRSPTHDFRKEPVPETASGLHDSNETTYRSVKVKNWVSVRELK